LESIKPENAAVQAIDAMCRILEEKLKEKRYLLLLLLLKPTVFFRNLQSLTNICTFTTIKKGKYLDLLMDYVRGVKMGQFWNVPELVCTG
jgi:hypothetical protein